MSLVMADPGLIEQAVTELGLDYSKVEEAKAKALSSSALGTTPNALGTNLLKRI